VGVGGVEGQLDVGRVQKTIVITSDGVGKNLSSGILQCRK
jgi:hypothetical protein